MGKRIEERPIIVQKKWLSDAFSDALTFRRDFKAKRKVRSDKRIRVNVPLSQESEKLLKRLALACGITKTELAREMIEMCLMETQIINHFQQKHNANEFRIIPYTENGKLFYLSANR